MPLKGLGLLKAKECSEKEWEKILKEMEIMLAENGYSFKEYIIKRWKQYETIRYTKKLKTIEELEGLKLFIEKIEIGTSLSAILVRIEYVDDMSIIPYKIKIEPDCWGWDSEWCKNGMAVISLVSQDIFAKIDLFKCVYYCDYENQDFITKGEREKAEEQDLSIALLTNLSFARNVVSIADRIK